jgi:hypothetical protein
MKTTSDLLRETFASVPTSFAYREVRFYVYQAMQKLQVLEKREAKKEVQNQEQLKIQEEKRQKYSPFYQNGYNVKPHLDIIEKMIAEEEKKINELQNKRDQLSKPENNEDNDQDIQTLHG